MLACPPQPASARAASSGGSSRRTVPGLSARRLPPSGAGTLELALPAAAGAAGTPARGVTPVAMRVRENICVCTRFGCPCTDHRKVGIRARHVHAPNLRGIPVFPAEHGCERLTLASRRLARVSRADGRGRARSDPKAHRHERSDDQPPHVPRDPVSPHHAQILVGILTSSSRRNDKPFTPLVAMEPTANR
jgi:hypothetical protein